MCRFVYDNVLIDKDNEVYFKDTESILDELNRLDGENKRLRSVFNSVLTSVNKDDRKCTLHISVDDYEYFKNILIEDEEETRSDGGKPLMVSVNREDIAPYTYTSKMHPPCFIYDCNKCPYLEYPFCTYERKNKKNE